MRNRGSPAEGRNPTPPVSTTSGVRLLGRIDEASETPRQRAESIHDAHLPLFPLPRRRGLAETPRSVQVDLQRVPVGEAPRVPKRRDRHVDGLVLGIQPRRRRSCAVLRGRWRF